MELRAKKLFFLKIENGNVMKMSKKEKKSIMYSILIMVLSIAFMVIPLQGLSISSLNIDVQPNTDVIFGIKFIATPEEKKLIDLYKTDFMKNITELGIIPSSQKSENSFVVQNYSSITTINGKTGYILPGFYYQNMTAIDGFPINVEILRIMAGNDLVPKTTTIRWPDGKKLTLSKIDYLPNLYHIIEAPVDTANVGVTKVVFTKKVTVKPAK